MDVTLDELFKELIDGKEKLATSITNKGVETTSESTFEEMADNIDNIKTSNEYELYTSGINTLSMNGKQTVFSDISLDSGKYIVIFAIASNILAKNIELTVTNSEVEQVVFNTKSATNGRLSVYIGKVVNNSDGSNITMTHTPNQSSDSSVAAYGYYIFKI